MLKTIKNTRLVAEPKKIKARVGANSMAGGNEIINPISSIKRKNHVKMTKSKNLVKSKNYDFPLNSRNIKARLCFFISRARLTFIKLR